MANLLKDILATLPRYLVHDLISSELKEQSSGSLLRQIYRKAERLIFKDPQPLPENGWWSAIGDFFKSALNTVEVKWWNTVDIFRSASALMDKNIFVIIFSFLGLALVMAMMWRLRNKAEPAPKIFLKERKRDLELFSQDNATKKYRYRKHWDSDSSENAAPVLTSRSDQTLIASNSAVTILEDETDSQTPVNFLPTVDVEMIITSTQYVLCVECGTCDFF